MNAGWEEDNKTEKTISIAEIVYLLYFTVMFGARAVGLYEGMLIYNISLVVGMLLFVFKVLLTEHTMLEYLVMGSMLLLSLVVYYYTGEKGLLLYFTMMLGMKAVSVRRVFKLGTFILSVAFTTLVLLSVTGIKPDIIYIHDRAGFGNVIRHSLGYPYPNTLFTTYIVLMVLVMYILGQQSKKNLCLTTLLLFIGSAYIYLYSCSNTGFIVAIFYLLVNLYLQFRSQLSGVEKCGILLVYPLCMLVSIVGPLVTSGKMFELFDKVLHNRWAYSLYYLTNEPVTLFGVRFQEAPNDNYMIDSSFLYSFLQIGVVAFVVLTVLFTGMIHDCVRQEKKTELAIIISFCLLGMSDPFWFNLSYKNLLFLFVGEFFYRVLQKCGNCNLGVLNHKIQVIPAGNYRFSYQKTFVERCDQMVKRIGRYLSQGSIRISLLYLVIAAIIIGVLYAFGWNDHIVGAVDAIEEWEYVRGVISIGLFGGVVLTIVYLIVSHGRSSKDKESTV